MNISYWISIIILLHTCGLWFYIRFEQFMNISFEHLFYLGFHQYFNLKLTRFHRWSKWKYFLMIFDFKKIRINTDWDSWDLHHSLQYSVNPIHKHLKYFESGLSFYLFLLVKWHGISTLLFVVSTNAVWLLT